MEIINDQHILMDSDILNEIVNNSNINKDEVVLEIGPGPCNLTELLLKKAKKVIVVELDINFEKKLSALKERKNNLEVHFGNALELIKYLKFDKIISNIPYTITEPLFKKLFRLNFKKGVFIIGKNFYDKINDKENKWCIIINSFYKIKLIKEISRNYFSPPPRTDSVLITIKPKKPDNFEKKIRLIELQDDKKLKNVLIKIFRDESNLTNNQAKDRLFDLLIPQSILEKNVDYLSNRQFLFVIEKLKTSLF